MEFFVLKLKGEDLYFNSDSEIGHFVDKTPILFENEVMVDELFMMDISVYDMDGKEYSINDFEKKKVTLIFGE